MYMFYYPDSQLSQFHCTLGHWYCSCFLVLSSVLQTTQPVYFTNKLEMILVWHPPSQRIAVIRCEILLLLTLEVIVRYAPDATNT